MHPPRDDKHDGDTEQRGGNDREPLGGDYVEIEHDCHAGRHKEKAHVGDEKFTDAFYGFDVDHFLLKQSSQQQHAENASGNRDCKNPGYEFSRGKACENNRALLNHIALKLYDLIYV